MERTEIGNDFLAADHVRCLGYRVEPSAIDLPDDRFVDLNAEISKALSIFECASDFGQHRRAEIGSAKRRTKRQT